VFGLKSNVLVLVVPSSSHLSATPPLICISGVACGLSAPRRMLGTPRIPYPSPPLPLPPLRPTYWPCPPLPARTPSPPGILPTGAYIREGGLPCSPRGQVVVVGPGGGSSRRLSAAAVAAAPR